MPKFPVIQSQVADPARAAQYSAPDVVPVQPQEPQQLQRLGQAMEQAGQQFSALAADRERRINLAAHTEREAAAKEIEIAKFSEFEQLEGQAAVKAFKSYSDEMVKRHEAAVRSAPEGPQREWLQNSLRQMRVRLLNSATSHRDKELRTWRIGGASASLQQSIKTAIAMHGSSYPYDTHVPILFWGPKWVAPGERKARAEVVDIAPTLAGLLAVPVPAQSEGRALPVGRRE